LKWQDIPDGYELHLCHVDDFTPGQRNAGRALLEAYGSTILSGEEQVATLDFDDKDPNTHLWQQSAFERVAKNKQQILDLAVKEHYDCVFICDTDLMLDRTTLRNLVGADQQVTAGVYWTRWTADQQHVLPQVWLRHPYQLDGRGWEYPELRTALSNRGLLQVWGLGACMLVRTGILQDQKVRYWPLLPELVAAGGMNAGEDRTFCELCTRSHIEMYADGFPDIYHVYRPEDAQHIDKYIQQFDLKYKASALYPIYGDYVNLQIMPSEDTRFGPQNIRGRVGQLNMLPALEHAVLGMQRGERRLLNLAFPIDYELTHTGSNENPPIVPYRANTRVVDVHMIDHQPYSYAPLLHEEYIIIDDNITVDTYKYSKEQYAQYRSVRHES
jgi:hypothetical protein